QRGETITESTFVVQLHRVVMAVPGKAGIRDVGEIRIGRKSKGIQARRQNFSRRVGVGIDTEMMDRVSDVGRLNAVVLRELELNGQVVALGVGSLHVIVLTRE